MKELWDAGALELDAEQVAKLASALGTDWEADGGVLVRGGVRFAVVPGGWLRMGFSPDDVLALCGARKRSPVGDDCTWAESIAAARPTRWARVNPLAVAIDPEHEPAAGERLPTEAELEWILSECGRCRFVGVDGEVTAKNRWKVIETARAPFGLEGVFDGPQVSSDRWPDGPRRGRPITREVHTAWQDDDEELIALHVAHRSAGVGVERAVFDLAAVVGEPPAGEPTSDDCAAVLTETRGAKGKPGKLAGYAMELLAASPGDDLVLLVEDVAQNLEPSAKPAELARDLAWLGAVGWGPGASALDGPADGELAAALAAAPVAPLLEHAKAPVRAAAVMVAAFADGAPAALAERFAAEKDPVAAASVIIALALLGAPPPPPHPKKEKSLAGARCVAAGIRGEGDLDALLASLGDKTLAKLPWFDGNPTTAVIGIARRGSEDVGAVAERLAEAGPSSGKAWWHHQRAVCMLAFEPLDPGPHRILDPASLDAPRRRLLAHFFQHRGRGLLPPGTRRSNLCRDMLLGDAKDSPFATEVELDGRTMPLYFALHELFAQDEEKVIDDREAWVDSLVDGGLETILSLKAAATKTGRNDLVLYSQNPFVPPPPSPWPYVGDRLYHRIRRAEADEREPLRDQWKASVHEALANGKRCAGDLLHLAAATVPPAAIEPEIRDAVTVADLRGFYDAGGRSRWLLDAFGPDWIERRLITWMKPVIEDLLAGRDGRGGLVPGSPAYLADPTWSTPTIAALVARDLVPRATDRAYTILHDNPDLRPQLDPLPKTVHTLYRRGEPTWTNNLSKTKRDAALQDLLALMT